MSRKGGGLLLSTGIFVVMHGIAHDGLCASDPFTESCTASLQPRFAGAGSRPTMPEPANYMTVALPTSTVTGTVGGIYR